MALNVSASSSCFILDEVMMASDEEKSDGEKMEGQKGVLIIKQLFFLNFRAITEPKSVCHYIRLGAKKQRRDQPNDFARVPTAFLHSRGAHHPFI